MKASLSRLILSILVALIFLVCALLVSANSYATSPGTANNDTMLVEKKITSRVHKVSLYPDAMQKVLFFSVKGESGKVYQLYLFDIDGHLVTQREIRNKQTTYISDFAKGLYLFDVFCDDERIGNGRIAIR